MKKVLGLITRTATGYAGQLPELSVMAVAKTKDEVERALSEGLTLYLEDVPDMDAVAQHFGDLPDEVREDYAGLDPVEVLVSPAPMNPVSAEVEQAIAASGLSYREVAKRMGTGHAAISRMTDPFYWGHSVSSLRKLAEVLGLTVQVKLLAA